MIVEETTGVIDVAPDEVLIDPRSTARRERGRQARRRERSGVAAAAMAVPHGLRRLGSAEAAEGGLRYQPVVWTVIAIVAIAFLFPRSEADVGPPTLAAPVASAGPATATTTTMTTLPEPAGATGSVAPATIASPPPALSSPPTTAYRPPAAATSPVSPVDDEPTPLRIESHGWAGTTGPVGGATVAEGALPVANRLGAPDKVSFLRLRGTATVLRLTEDPEGASEPLGDAVVKLCLAEDGWEETGGQQLGETTRWSSTCVEGVESDGDWTFDLSGMGDAERRNGFALVPGDDAPPEFQITFSV